MLPSAYTPELVSKVSPLGLDTDGMVDADSLRRQQDWYVAHGLVKTAANIDEVVDNSFAQRARSVLAGH
jgi:hypothetical protein